MLESHEFGTIISFEPMFWTTIFVLIWTGESGTVIVRVDCVLVKCNMALSLVAAGKHGSRIAFSSILIILPTSMVVKTSVDDTVIQLLL